MNKILAVNKKNDATAEILLYGYIYSGGVSASDFAKELRELEKDYSRIDVRINSGGGDVFEGIGIYNAMKRSKAHIETYNDGIAGSMGSIVLMAGTIVHMSKNAKLMIHQASAGGYGTKDDLLNIAEALEGVNQTMTAIYAKKSGKDAAYVKEKWMNGKDNYLTAEEAKNEGLVDSVYDGEDVQVPAEAKTEKEIWAAFDLRFAAKLNQQNNNSNMEKIILSASCMTILGITDANAINPALIEAKVTELNAKVTAAEAAKTKAENELAAHKKTDVGAMVDAAVTETKCTKEAGEQLKKLFAENPDELKAYIATLKPYAPVTGSNDDGNDDGRALEIKALMAKTGEELWKNGGLDRLKELGAKSEFKVKYHEAFGEYPAEEKKEK